MEDKVFELIEKMYTDLKAEIKAVKTDLKTEIQTVQSNLNAEIQAVKSELKAEVQTVGNQVTMLENDHGKKLDALMDGYKQLAEGQEEIKSQIQDINSKVTNQEVEKTVLKGGKGKIRKT